jgi:hypothetical protein
MVDYRKYFSLSRYLADGLATISRAPIQISRFEAKVLQALCVRDTLTSLVCTQRT